MSREAFAEYTNLAFGLTSALVLGPFVEPLLPEPVHPFVDPAVGLATVIFTAAAINLVGLGVRVDATWRNADTGQTLVNEPLITVGAHSRSQIFEVSVEGVFSSGMGYIAKKAASRHQLALRIHVDSDVVRILKSGRKLKQVDEQTVEIKLQGAPGPGLDWGFGRVEVEISDDVILHQARITQRVVVRGNADRSNWWGPLMKVKSNVTRVRVETSRS